jgi:hypothetical protein
MQAKEKMRRSEQGRGAPPNDEYRIMKSEFEISPFAQVTCLHSFILLNLHFIIPEWGP